MFSLPPAILTYALHSQYFVGKCKWVTILVVAIPPPPPYTSPPSAALRNTMVFQKAKHPYVVLTAAMPKWSLECMCFSFLCVAVALKICVYSLCMMFMGINFFGMLYGVNQQPSCQAEMFLEMFCYKATAKFKMCTAVCPCLLKQTLEGSSLLMMPWQPLTQQIHH